MMTQPLEVGKVYRVSVRGIEGLSQRPVLCQGNDPYVWYAAGCPAWYLTPDFVERDGKPVPAKNPEDGLISWPVYQGEDKGWHIVLYNRTKGKQEVHEATINPNDV